ncbi:unnamed protein product [Meganyctiphanes norvegica]|uniref:Uncharacterized protein n=1 Tax=Meganyctiphanes norvegica TaxID=48144 RepID=A0AAV2R7Z3_MEGNR
MGVMGLNFIMLIAATVAGILGEHSKDAATRVVLNTMTVAATRVALTTRTVAATRVALNTGTVAATRVALHTLNTRAVAAGRTTAITAEAAAAQLEEVADFLISTSADVAAPLIKQDGAPQVTFENQTHVILRKLTTTTSTTTTTTASPPPSPPPPPPPPTTTTRTTPLPITSSPNIRTIKANMRDGLPDDGRWKPWLYKKGGMNSGKYYNRYHYKPGVYDMGMHHW